ncbi:MAG: PQQ-binding-like beta-propeller repeat protein [Alphaproteobacteria bacterium]|nr:PQQ-binding-like beta-propeller repeat protein [Alphaproteobacteria bacterium]
MTMIKKLSLVVSAGILSISAIGAAAWGWHTDNWKSIQGNAVSCRARLYLQKARGEVPELSWSELWELTLPGRGFHCLEGGTSLEASIQYSTYASEEDRSAGARIFRERCTGCHGDDGSGGPVGPSLTRPQYKHGDSDLAIYQVLKNGISGTAMPKAGLPVRELLQVTAHLRMLQAHSSEDNRPKARRLAIHVNSERLRAAGSNPDEWLMYSGSYNGWRHTSLAEITPANVAQLRIRWIKQFDITGTIIEATPLVIDNVIFMVAEAGHVVALDDKTGDVIWEYKRPVPPDLPLIAGPVNRGLAVHGSTLFFGSLDGYLVAIDANDGKVIWQTLVGSSSDGYSITGAPLVVNDSVVVGVAGGDFGIRGFLAAYDVSTGQRQWKFETIPGPGEVGHETWENDAWRTGGGATWNTGSYDPATGLLYWGVGNPSPDFSPDVRPGDNLFTDSVIALRATTGKLAWYFQFTPHDEHDRDAAQTPVLADLMINDVVRKVICWPNRNGFYYVLDRVTGEFLAGVPFVELDWAQGLTNAGRPILSNIATVSTAGRRTKPGIDGATNWQNSAFDQGRGSIFVPAAENSSVFTKAPPDRVTHGPNGRFEGSGWIQTEPAINQVLALDAATGRLKWKYKSPQPPGQWYHYSGLLSTGGGLVFGASGGICFALDADTGREVWHVSLGGNTKSAPISFVVDGHQVVGVAAGRALFVFEL